MKISDHITYAEAIHSNTAKRKGIDNTPNPTQVENMKLLAEKIFEPLRKWTSGPIKVNSFFRSPELNTAIGGCLLYTSPSPRDRQKSRMPSSA